LASGNPGWAYGAIADLVSGGARKIAILSDNEGASEFGNALGVKALKLAGLTPVNDVAADPTSDPTFTTAAAKAVAGKVDGLFLFTDPNYAPAAMRALRSAGYTGPIADELVDFTPPILKALGSLGNGIELVGSVSVQSDTSNPAVRAFLDDMKKYQPQATLDEESENSWAAVQLYAKVMAKATDFSSSHVLSLMQNLSTPINVGVAGPYLVKGAKPVLAGYPRIFNQDIVEGVVRNGVIEPNGHGFVNPFQLLRSANHG
jgi:ABC-type branched-subunit amino acid transport system substrate-binding protein